MNMFRAVVFQDRLAEAGIFRTIVAGTLLHDEPLRIPRVRYSALSEATYPLVLNVPDGGVLRAALEAGQFSHVRNVDLRTMTTTAWFTLLGGQYGNLPLDLLPVHEDLVLKP